MAKRPGRPPGTSGRAAVLSASQVRHVFHLRAAYTKGGRTRDVFLSSPALRRVLSKYGEGRWLLGARASHAPLFPSQKGGPMTPASMARFIKALYREAGISGASSHSGRRTLITRLAERGIDFEGDRGDRGAQQHPHDRRLRRVQPATTRPHPSGSHVVTAPRYGHSLLLRKNNHQRGV